MVRLTKIYTRGGDRGQTSLGDGTRVAKHELRVAAYGTVDEANAAIGLARQHTETLADAMLARIQNDLFDVGADLCRPGEDDSGLRVRSAQVTRLEEEIDALNRTEQAELVALMWIGRGDAEPEEWDDMLKLAEERREVPTSQYLLDHPMVADEWAEALDKLGYGSMVEGVQEI